jgi:uncharacterized lipoprotein YbaY
MIRRSAMIKTTREIALIVGVVLFGVFVMLAGRAAAQSIQGTAAYDAQIALSPAAVLEVSLDDVTLVATPTTIATMYVPRPLTSPVAFTLAYDPQRIIHSHRYAVRGKILVDGKPLLTSDATAFVITYGSPSTVALTLRPVAPTPEPDPAATAEEAKSRTAKAPASSPLQGTSWQLVQFQGTDGSAVAPDERTKYTIEFGDGGQVAVRLDCNRGRGSWKSAGPNQLQLGPLALTRANCPEGSLHNRMVNHWALVRSFAIKDDHLFLALSVGGIYEFEPLGTRQE